MKDKTVIIIISAAVFILMVSIVIGLVMIGKFMKSVITERPQIPPMPGMGSPLNSEDQGVPGMMPEMQSLMPMMPGADNTALPPKFLLDNPTIKLTKDQSAKIDAIYKTNESVIKPIVKKMINENVKFRKVLISPKADIKSIQKEKNILARIENDIENINIESWIKIKSVLKPDQLVNFEKSLTNFFAGPPGMPGMMMPPSAPQGIPQGGPGMPPPNQQPMPARPY